MIEPLSHGFLLGFSLIFAIGAQNIFVLRQGLVKRHVLSVVLFCSVSDLILIFSGIFGISFFVSPEFFWAKSYLFYFAAMWLFVYGCIRIKGALIKSSFLSFKQQQESNFWSTMGTVFIITFVNPHVYLDTVFLIGTISLQYDGYKEILFGLGASTASFFFFFSLGYGSQILLPILSSSKAWRVFDLIIAIIMFFLAISLLISSGLFEDRLI